jgi:polysaccharide biosynthesis/export protein
MDFYYSRYLLRPNVQLIPLVAIICIVLLNACSAPIKSTAYFRNIPKDTVIAANPAYGAPTKILSKDVLSINISSLNRDEDVMFNAAAGLINSISDKSPGYQVDGDGFIQIHKVGKIKAVGLTRKELQDKLQVDLLPFLKDPIVTIQFLNHKVSVLGDVIRPQVVNMPEESLTLIDVLVTSGDISPTGRKDNIMIIREQGAEKLIKYVSLEDHSILSSPWFYMQANDIVYVAPNDAKRIKEERKTKFQNYFSLAASSVSLFVIILDRILR